MMAPYKCVVVANGRFPVLPAALEMLGRASVIIACDGAVGSLCAKGFVPDAIVGDLDSIADDLRLRYADRLYGEAEQDTNDLTKAIRFASASRLTDVMILGATGLREDHTVGNISLLLDYAAMLDRVEMLGEYGLFTPLLDSGRLTSCKGQQVSIFAPHPGVEIVGTDGLKWPIERRILTSWWQGSLNEALGDEFGIDISGGGVIVYRLFVD